MATSRFYGGMMMLRSIAALTLVLLAGPIASAAGSVSIFEDATAMFETLGDYGREDGTLKILSKHPLSIQLVEFVFPNDIPEVIRENTQRAIIYGVYRTFIHTDVDTVTVSAVPGQINPPGMRIRKMLEDYRVTVTISRAHALAHAQKFCRVASIQALVGDRVYGNVTVPNHWIECFEKLQYNDQGGPGLAKFFPGLGE